MNMHVLNKPEPSWRELAKLIREMSWDERREFFRMALLPWPNRVDNIKMWVRCLAVTIANIIVVVALIRATSNTYPVWVGMAIMFSVGATYMTATLQTWARGLALGVRARHAEVNRKMMEEMQKVVDAMGEEILTRLKQATGREHIDNNPVSMAAANLDLLDKSRRPRRVDNPLQAALEDRLHPNDLVNDEDDDESVN